MARLPIEEYGGLPKLLWRDGLGDEAVLADVGRRGRLGLIERVELAMTFDDRAPPLRGDEWSAWASSSFSCCSLIFVAA